jgi:hypothetical protein
MVNIEQSTCGARLNMWGTRGLVCCAVLIAAAQAMAACGGGGFKSNSASNANLAETFRPDEMAEFRQPATTQPGVSYRLDTSRFDTISAKLELSATQLQEIAQAKSEINAQTRLLLAKQREAQRVLDECTSDCAALRRELVAATKTLQAFDAGGEFLRRLWTILRPGQQEIYLRIATMNIDLKTVARR